MNIAKKAEYIYTSKLVDAQERFCNTLGKDKSKNEAQLFSKTHFIGLFFQSSKQKNGSPILPYLLGTVSLLDQMIIFLTFRRFQFHDSWEVLYVFFYNQSIDFNRSFCSFTRCSCWAERSLFTGLCAITSAVKGGLSWFLPMLARKFANQPYLTQQKLGQLAHCCWISCWISRMLHPFTSTISRSPPVPFTLSAPASVALPLPVPLVPWHGSPVRKEISYGFGSLFRSLWQQLCYFTTIQVYIYIPIKLLKPPEKFWVSFCLDILSATNAHQLHPPPETPRPAHHSKLKLCPASKPKQLGLVISDLLSGKLT